MTRSQVLCLPRFAVIVGVLTIAARPALAQNVTGVCAEIGITPESVVIADLDAQSAMVILGRVESAVALCESLAAHHDAADAVAATITELSELMLNDADEDVLQEYEAAVATLAAGQQQITALREALFDFALDGFPAPKIQRITVWRQGSPYRVHRAFRAKELEHDTWKAIERALRAEQRAIRLGQDLEEEPAQLLADIRSDPAVVEAGLRLEANFDQMKVVFEQFED